MWFIGVGVEQETTAPPPKKNPGSAPGKWLFILMPFSSAEVSLGTLRSGDGEDSENVDEKVNSRSFNLHRDYSKSLTLSNVGNPS